MWKGKYDSKKRLIEIVIKNLEDGKISDKSLHVIEISQGFQIYLVEDKISVP